MILSYSEFLEEKSNPCWKGYKQIGTKKKNGRIVPNCVRESENTAGDGVLREISGETRVHKKSLV